MRSTLGISLMLQLVSQYDTIQHGEIKVNKKRNSVGEQNQREQAHRLSGLRFHVYARDF